MRSRVSWGRLSVRLTLLLLLPSPLLAVDPVLHYHIVGDEPGAWPEILSSVGLVAGAQGSNAVYVLPSGTTATPDQWRDRIFSGAMVILEGESELAASFGIRPLPGKKVPVRAVVDAHNPRLDIVWEKSIDIPRFDLPAGASITAKSRHSDLPLIATLAYGQGAVLWIAASPGVTGHERFPYIAQALGDLGLKPPFSSRRLWAFFDASYRSRVDLDWMSLQWRRAGIAALHVAAWHFYEPDEKRDEYLRKLIEASHRRNILVYAWLELPHVSEQFWRDHPEWRERTAIGQDAHLDWRKLMNLSSPDCGRAVEDGVRQLLDRFDWDGVNLAELYFESLEGHANAARFTPMSREPRDEFREAHRFDPIELFQQDSPRHWSGNPEGLRAFLDYRITLTHRMQLDWIDRLDQIRRKKAHLDLVLTHVDDRYDSRMRDLIGTDAARLLPLLQQRDFTFLVEDPATVWHLGAERYTEIARRYAPITPRPNKLAIDLNIVPRYQDVYPTRQQTGTELYRLVNHASRAFPRVALYFENSILPQDRLWLSSAAAAVERVERIGGKLIVSSPRGIGVPWLGSALVNGRLWPVQDHERLWLPPGRYAVESAGNSPFMRLVDFTGDLDAASTTLRGIEFTYRSDSRAFALLDRFPDLIEVDGEIGDLPIIQQESGWQVLLPRGQHLIAISARPPG